MIGKESTMHPKPHKTFMLGWNCKIPDPLPLAATLSIPFDNQNASNAVSINNIGC